MLCMRASHFFLLHFSVLVASPSTHEMSLHVPRHFSALQRNLFVVKTKFQIFFVLKDIYYLVFFFVLSVSISGVGGKQLGSMTSLNLFLFTWRKLCETAHRESFAFSERATAFHNNNQEKIFFSLFFIRFDTTN